MHYLNTLSLLSLVLVLNSPSYTAFPHISLSPPPTTPCALLTAGRCEARDISMSLYGLKELSSTHNETLALIAQIVPHIRDNFDGGVSPTGTPLSSSQPPLSAQNVAAAMQGLQKMRSGTKEVDELVAVMGHLVAGAQGAFSSKGLSMALSGLQGLSSKHAGGCSSFSPYPILFPLITTPHHSPQT